MHLEAALAIARELQDRTLQSDAHNGLGMLTVFSADRTRLACISNRRSAWPGHARTADRRAACSPTSAFSTSTRGAWMRRVAHDEAALAVARRGATGWLEGNVLCNLGLLHQVQGSFAEALDQLDAALAVTRDIGNARVECIALCNLGMVYASLARLDEAEIVSRRRWSSPATSGDRRSEGQFLSYLGLLHARMANFDEARDCLDAGEALLHAVSDQMSLGILLCSRAEAEHLGRAPRRRKCSACRR